MGLQILMDQLCGERMKTIFDVESLAILMLTLNIVTMLTFNYNIALDLDMVRHV